MEDEPDDVPKAGRDSLEVALAFLRSCLPANGGVPDGEQDGAEWRALETWSLQTSRRLSAGFHGLRLGGAEHGLYFHEATQRWVKVTKPGMSGYTANVDIEDDRPRLIPATPAQYLRQLSLANRYFNDDIRFEGVLSSPPRSSLVISQPHVVGVAPSLDQIDLWMRMEGYHRLDIAPVGARVSLSYTNGTLGVFDCHPANFVWAEEIPVPIDLILVELDADQAAYLDSLRVR